MPELSKIAADLKKQMEELDRLQREHQKNIANTQSTIKALQMQLEEFDRKRKSK